VVSPGVVGIRDRAVAGAGNRDRLGPKWHADLRSGGAAQRGAVMRRFFPSSPPPGHDSQSPPVKNVRLRSNVLSGAWALGSLGAPVLGPSVVPAGSVAWARPGRSRGLPSDFCHVRGCLSESPRPVGRFALVKGVPSAEAHRGRGGDGHGSWSAGTHRVSQEGRQDVRRTGTGQASATSMSRYSLRRRCKGIGQSEPLAMACQFHVPVGKARGYRQVSVCAPVILSCFNTTAT